MLRRHLRHLLTTITASIAFTALFAATPAAAADAQDLAHLCERVGHSCGASVDHGDAEIIGRFYGIGIGSSLDEEDIQRILGASQRQTSTAQAATTTDASALLPLCAAVGHSCGASVDHGDAEIIGRFYGIGIGSVLDAEDVERILNAATRVRAASTSVQAVEVGPEALRPLCAVALHSCGSTVDDSDVQAIARWYRLDIGSSVESEDVQRVHATATHRYSTWDRVAHCESTSRWSYRGYYHGGLQFHPGTWRSYAPSGYPSYAYNATREQQIYVAERVLASQGWGAWPSCSSKLGLR